MTKTETKARAGEAVTPAEELKTAITGFMKDFKSFSTDIHARLQQQEDRMTKLDRKTQMTGAQRPALGATDYEAPHKKAFNAYLRSGNDDALLGLELEGKAMSTQINSDGGYLVDPETSDMIRSALNGAASLRAIADVVQVNATSFDVLVDHGELGAVWGDETGPLSETATPSIDRISIPVFELNALPKVSQRLLDDSAFDIDTWLAGRIAEKFVRAESDAFINGDGADKPRGIMDYTAVPNDSWTWGNLGYVATGVDGDFDTPNPGDALIDLVYALGAQYRPNATFVMNSATATRVRQLKDADGRYLWADGFSSAEPARLMGYPVLICEDMPSIGSGTTPVAFGDFGRGYTIAERPDLRILRDPYSAKPHVLFYATKRVGGGVSDYAAIKLLRFSVS